MSEDESPDDVGIEAFIQGTEEQAELAVRIAYHQPREVLTMSLLTLGLAEDYVRRGVAEGPLSRLVPPLMNEIVWAASRSSLTAEDFGQIAEEIVKEPTPAAVEEMQRLLGVVERASLEHRVQAVLTAQRYLVADFADAIREALPPAQT